MMDQPENIPETYALGEINGFLKFANRYINKSYFGTPYKNRFYFKKSKDLESIVPERFKEENYRFEQLRPDDYEIVLRDFLTEKLTINDSNIEQLTKHLVQDLYELINNFLKGDIQNVYKIETFYDDIIVMEHRGEFYMLNCIWIS